ncbi:MAG: PAS domain-containing sensor histidine kinase [Ekhidna sp.]
MTAKELTTLAHKNQFEEIFEHSPYAIFIHDYERILDVNVAFLELYGYESKDEIIGKAPISTLVAPEDIESFKNATETAHSTSATLIPSVRLKKKNQDFFSAEAHISAISSDDGALFQVYSVDVTKSIEAQKETLEKGREYRRLFNNSLDGIYKSTPAGRFVDVNSALVQMLGYDSEEELLAIDIKTELYFKIEDRRIMAAHEEDQYPLKRKDGSAIWVEDHSYYERDEKGNILFHHGILRDVTSKLEKKNELEELLSVMESQNKKLQNFAHIISHNIRSHSSNLTALVQFMEDEASPDAKERFFDMIKTSTMKLEETIRNLNEIITIQNSNKPKELRNLREEVDNTFKILSGNIIASKIAVKIDIPKDLQVKVIPAYLDSILLNIVSNSIKYRSNERDSFIEIRARIDEECTLITVSDNGIGIDLCKHRKKLFGMYETFHTNDDSRGFGLYITKNQIESMGGKIEVESTLDVGTSVSIYLKN